MSEKFKAHELETGLLQRVRSWREVFPPLGLLPALRVAGSPFFITLWLVTVLAIATFPASDEVRLPGAGLPSIHPIAACFIPLVILFPATMTMRAGALYAASRDNDSFIAHARLISGRIVTLLLVLILPWVCVVGLSVPVFGLGLLDRIPGFGDASSEVAAVVALPIILLLGMIATGAIVAIPIGWASVAIEKRCDAFDALSRGFEYLYRRPVQFAVYGVTGALLSALVGVIAYAVAWAANVITMPVYAIASGGKSLPFVVTTSLAAIPFAAVACTWFATFGATYLMLRYDANDQEIEDVVVSAVDRKSKELPTLKNP